MLISDAPNNTIGGANTIGHNGGRGIEINDSIATGNVVLGNYIGTDASGDNLGNGGDGIYIGDAPNNTVGGAGNAANTIGFNFDGIDITGSGATGNVVLGNFIGTNASGDNLGNDVDGVLIDGGSNNVVGGASPNTIGFNTQQGVLIVSGTQNVISQNLYVGANGPGTPVQANDIVLLPGANNNQSAPTLLTTYLSAGNLVAEVSGIPVGTTVELYQATTAAPGQRTFLGSGSVSSVNGILTVTIIPRARCPTARRSWRQGR